MTMVQCRIRCSLVGECSAFLHLLLGLIPFTTPTNATSFLPTLIICIGALGPALAAIIMSASIGGWAEVKQLLRRMIQVRVGIQWYLLALCVPLIPFFVIIILFNGFSVFLHVFSLRGVGGLLAYVIATFIGMVLGSPIGEEPG